MTIREFDAKQFVSLTPKTIEALDDFLGQIEVTSFKRQLRSLLLYYLTHEAEELPPDAGHFIEDLKYFFDFLDVAGDEVGGQ